MPLYYGKNTEEVGDIMHKDFISNKAEPMIGVFWRDELIWPSVSKYLFWATNHDNILINCDDPIVVNAGHNKVTIYVRSCTRYYRDRYPYRVSCTNNWCTLEDNVTEDTFYPDFNEDGTENKEDSKFILDIKPNYGSQSRNTWVLLQQIDHIDGNVLSGKQQVIKILQTMDKPVGNPDYSIPIINWYSDANFITKVESYGSISNPIVSVNGGTQNVYFTIEGKALMTSGSYSSYYYGDNGETLSFSNFVFSDPTEIDSIDNIQYFGYGQWKATIHWKANFPKGNALKTYIKNLKLSNDSVSTQGDIISILWSIYKGGNSSTKQSEIALRLNGYNSSNGHISVFQDGGSIIEKTSSEKCSVYVHNGGTSWCKLSGNQSFTSNGDYVQNLEVSPQNPIDKMYIEDLSVNGSENIPFDATSGKIVFYIYKRNNVYEERRTYVYVECNNIVESIDVVQKGNENSTAVAVSDDMLSASKITISEDNDKNDNYWTDFIKYSDIKYDNWLEQWSVSFSCSANLKHNIDKTIFLTSYPESISSKSQDISVLWTVKSGEVNSINRHSRIHIIIKDYNCDVYDEITQDASENAQQTTYYDDDAKKVTLKNITDSTVGSFSSISNHVCTGKLKVLENKTKKDGTTLFVQPTEVDEWSFSDIDNDSNASIYLKIKGKNGYESDYRSISLSLSGTGLSTVSVNVKQDPADFVLSDDLVECSDLAMSEFSLSDNSEGNLVRSSSLGHGLYKIDVAVNPNIKATHYIMSLNLSNQVVVEERYEIGQPKNITTSTLNVSPKYDNAHYPILTSWKSYGDPVSRTVSLKIKTIGKTLVSKWENLMYSGEEYSHNLLNKDYSLSLQNGKWDKIEDNIIVTSTNTTESSRNDILTIKYIVSNDDVSKIMTVPIKQEVKSRESDYVFWTNIQSYDPIKISPLNGSPSSFTFYVTSYDDETNSPLDISMTEPSNFDGLNVEKSISDGVYSIKLIPTAINMTESTKRWTINITQNESEKKISVNVEQPNYVLNVDQSTIYIDVNSSTVLNVQSYSSNMYVDFRCEVYSDWALVTNIDSSKKRVTCLTVNNTNNDRECYIKITQNGSEISKIVKVVNRCWANPNLDTSDIDLYKKNDKVSRVFLSKESSQSIDASMSEVYSNMNDEVKASLAKSDDKWVFSVESSSSIDGDIPKMSKYMIWNKNQTIGYINVTLHAFKLSATSETKDNVITWYVSPRRNEIWSMYYVNSTMDKVLVDYEVTIGDGNNPIYVSKNGSSVYVSSSTENTLDKRIEYNGYIIQSKSSRKLELKIIQLIESDYEEIYI